MVGSERDCGGFGDNCGCFSIYCGGFGDNCGGLTHNGGCREWSDLIDMPRLAYDFLLWESIVDRACSEWHGIETRVHVATTKKNTTLKRLYWP